MFVSSVSNALIGGAQFDISFTDYTTQEYFRHIQDSRFPCSHIDITATCITYFSFNVFDRDFYQQESELEEFLRSYALLDYTAQYWGYHTSGHAEDIVLEFLELKSMSFVNHVMLM